MVYPIHDQEEKLGVVVAEQSNLRILSELRITLENVIGSTLLLILGAALILITIATRLTLRLHRLRQQTSQAIDQSGRIIQETIEAEKDSLDELGDLSRSISHMLKRLSRYNHYLERMPRMLKHEILNPLNIVSTSLEHLEQAIPATEQSHNYLIKSRRGIGRLGSMVQSLAEASSLEDALAPGSEEPFDLQQLLEEYLDNYRNTHLDHAFTVSLPSQPIPLKGWPYAIEQMLDNLLNNAIDYSLPNHPIEIIVKQQTDTVQIAILNRGPAIDEEIRDSLFESMVSSRRESDSERPHLGLGLYIVRLVAIHHGGSVTAENERGVDGACFTVRLPINVAGNDSPLPVTDSDHHPM